ncbi:MAG: hypothetical protein J7L44_03055 [Candidatus Diapherotrites archaeon]|nr:hypothetical protein [Candidatus Diapherotrites archaeon]
MQVIEVVVFFVFAVLVGMLVISFITGFDFAKLQKTIVSIFVPEVEEPKDFKTVTYYAFLKALADCWRDCAYGAVDLNCGAFFIEAELENYGKELDEDALKSYFEKYNVCEDCKIKIANPPLKIPSVAKLRCDADLNCLLIEN